MLRSEHLGFQAFGLTKVHLWVRHGGVLPPLAAKRVPAEFYIAMRVDICKRERIITFFSLTDVEMLFSYRVSP